jgi:hypothetical protein
MNMSVTHFRTFYQAHGKAPAEKYKGVPHLHTLDEARQFYEYGGVVADGRVTVDIDELSQFQAALAECDSLKLNYSARLTSRGGHLDFSDPLGMVKKGSTHALCAGGLTVDYRIPGQCIALKIGGEERKYIRVADMNQPVSPIPPFLRPCSVAKDLSGVAPGGGRNSALYGYCATLMRAGFTTEETRSVIRFINAHRFSTPLTEDELRVILRDEAFANLTKPNVVTAFNDCPVELLTALSKLRPEVNPMYPATDIGCGRLFADVFKPVARYVPERKMWFTYNGSRWITDVGNLASMELCKMLADALVQYAQSVEIDMKKRRSTNPSQDGR